MIIIIITPPGVLASCRHMFSSPMRYMHKLWRKSTQFDSKRPSQISFPLLAENKFHSGTGNLSCPLRTQSIWCPRPFHCKVIFYHFITTACNRWRVQIDKQQWHEAKENYIFLKVSPGIPSDIHTIKTNTNIELFHDFPLTWILFQHFPLAFPGFP